jgi:hypothetical protein
MLRIRCAPSVSTPQDLVLLSNGAAHLCGYPLDDCSLRNDIPYYGKMLGQRTLKNGPDIWNWHLFISWFENQLAAAIESHATSISSPEMKYGPGSPVCNGRILHMAKLRANESIGTALA